MKTQCPTCKAKINAPDDYMGRKVKCPECSGIFICMPFMKHNHKLHSLKEPKQHCERKIERLQISFNHVCPNIMANMGLVNSFKELVQKVSDFGVQCSFQGQITTQIKDNNIAMNLYRIAQEAIINALKHGHAHHVWINLQTTEKLIRLSIRDDGVGIPKDLSNCSGRGLKIMAYRSSLIGGSIQIKPDPSGAGTLLEFNLGVKQTKQTEKSATPFISDGWGSL